VSRSSQCPPARRRSRAERTALSALSTSFRNYDGVFSRRPAGERCLAPTVGAGHARPTAKHSSTDGNMSPQFRMGVLRDCLGITVPLLRSERTHACRVGTRADARRPGKEVSRRVSTRHARVRALQQHPESGTDISRQAPSRCLPGGGMPLPAARPPLHGDDSGQPARRHGERSF